MAQLHDTFSNLRLNVGLLLLLAIATANQSSISGADPNPVRLWPDGHRPTLTTSKVIGSPDPPLPYTTERRYPNLKLTLPIMLNRQPGSNLQIAITLDGEKGKSILRRFVDQPDVSESEVILPADDRIVFDFAFHPKFQENGFIYLGQNRPITPEGEKHSQAVRYRINRQPPYELDRNSETTIISWPSDGHNGAAIAFGLDGMLYITAGDGTSDSDTNVRGQEMKELTSKLIRIDVDHPTDGRMYSIPPDNPFVGNAEVAPETWAFGFRNPWRMTVDSKTGHIWVGNNGQDLWEQIFFVQKGDNFGWSVFEGSYPFYLNRSLGPAPHTKPALEHPHSEARSLTGGIVYYGGQQPQLQGAYIYGDYSTGKIWGARHDGTKVTWHEELTDTAFRITGFATNLDGDLLVCDYEEDGNGAFYAIVPAPPAPATNTFPKKLSETGLFESVPGHVVKPSLIPYAVNAPLWSDGAEKARFIAIPGEEPKIRIKDSKGWEFPNETVLVKSFSLPVNEADPQSQKWIETRLLTRQQNEWVGYSYKWNDEQTEATLVAKEGADATFVISTADGRRELPWHFPSRTECMVCHSRAAAFVLGLNTGQMNRDVPEIAHAMSASFSSTTPQSKPETAAPSENQLAMLERLGLLEWKKRPEEIERLVDPYDVAQPLQARAKSYLHANCAICHVAAGGGNAQMELSYSTSLEKMKLIDEIPVHDKFGIADARLISPGHPERSVLLHRISTREKGKMPQLATVLVDERAVNLFTEWITELTTLPAAPETESTDSDQTK